MEQNIMAVNKAELRVAFPMVGGKVFIKWDASKVIQDVTICAVITPIEHVVCVFQFE